MNNKTSRAALLLLGALCFAQLLASGPSLARAQRDNDDDFDDSGFDDSGYANSPSGQSRDAEESNQNPSNYNPGANEEELDDDDDVDETHLNSQVSRQHPAQMQQNNRLRQQQQQQQYFGNVAPTQFYAPPNSVLLAGFEPAAANHPQIYAPSGHQARRYR